MEEKTKFLWITQKESPFTPGRPVPIEYFIARIKEIERLERAIKQASSGRNENIFIMGERGIGKSSLAGFIRYVAQKDYQFIGAHCSLGSARNLDEVCRLIFQKLLQELPDKNLFEKVKDIFGKYIKNIDLLGMNIEFTTSKDELDNLRLNFLPTLRSLFSKIQNEKKGITVVLDDLNGIADISDFSFFLKSIVDEIATSGKKLPLLLILVGIPERREKMIKHQPSVARIFDIIDLAPMNKEETEDFFRKMFGRQNISIEPEAISSMVDLSGGFPTLMHEVGDAIFWEDKDNKIDEEDARYGIIDAAENVGRKYLAPQVYKAIGSETYRSILRKIGDLPLGTNFQRREILKKMSEEEQKTFDNFLQRIKRLGIINETEIRGEYRFVNQLYHLYVMLEAFKFRERQRS
ncbi:MAG: BREX system ATP-binding domain-containing protein [bacterium]